MSDTPNKDPLHGIKLKQILIELEEFYGWEAMGEKTDIRCFTNEPTLNSSLKFLRRTPWARKEVEELYLTAMKSPWWKKQAE